MRILVVTLLLITVILAEDDQKVSEFEKYVLSQERIWEKYELPKNANQYEANGTGVEEHGTYDYILVGCGSAGSVVASRLSERNHSILVLEAGGFEDDFVDIPYAYFYVGNFVYNWGYQSVPQKTSCLGMIDKKCPFPRGKGFGGTGLINGLVYTRGNKFDYDLWESQGNPGWSYRDVLPFFIKQENAVINNAEKEYHGKGGLLNVEYSKPYSKQLCAFLDANVELGRKVLDYNGREQLGVSGCQLNTRNGVRDSPSKTFLFPALKRRNLELLPESFATKILIDKNTKSANGVEFTRNQKKYTAKASKEVILSAGTIASPQLLMLSGVGPANDLKKLNIPLVKDLDVGKNLDDHPTFYGFNILSNYSEPIESVNAYIRKYFKGLAPYTIPGNNQGLGFFQTNSADKSGAPDIEIMAIPSNRTNPVLSQRAYLFTNESAEALWGNTNNTSSFTFYVVVLHPVSRGTIKLKSRSPFEYPLIDPELLSDSGNKDIETLYRGVKLVLEMLNTKAMKRINATLDKVVHPNCASLEYLSDDYWYCTIRHYTMNLYHPVSTCKMGPDPRKGAVVDAKLKVHGIRKLRVADASVIPSSLSGHPNAAIMMIGERLADFINSKK